MSVVIPANFQFNTLYPKIIIKNHAGAVQYTHESKAIFPAGTRDFQLTAFKLQQGWYDNYGSLVLIIPDHNNLLTDGTSPNMTCKIEREWEIYMDLGISSGTLQRYFHGKIRDAQIDRPGTNQQQVILSCIGWGVILKERMTKLARNQDKTSDGVTLDDADTKTRIDNLLLDIFQDKDHQIDENIPQLGNITAALTTDGLGICGACTTTKVANVNFSISTYAQAIDTLCSISNVGWRINEDRKLVVHDPNAHDSGMLFSNDFTPGSDTVNWTGTKLGYLLQSPIAWSDTSIDTYYNWLHGWGHYTPSLKASDGQTPDALDNLDNMWHAIPFSYKQDDLFKIAVRLARTGTPATSSAIEIWGQDGSSKPLNTDIRRSIVIAKEKLQSLGTSAPSAWFEVPVKPRLDITPGEQLFIVFPKYGDASNTINVNYKSGVGTYYDSSDGATWTARTGTSSYRVYNAHAMTTSLEIVDTTAELGEPRERMFPIRADMEEQSVRQTLLAVAETLGKQRRLYENILVSIPQNRVNVGQFCRIIDNKTGLDIKAIITGFTIQANQYRGDMGATQMEITLEEIL